MIDIKFPTVYKCHTHYATFELPEGCKECREEIDMKEKEYEEHEVWVDSGWSYERTVGNWSRTPIENGVKATLLIPKPERKVEITEGELREVLDRFCNYRRHEAIEEIFGRD